MPEMPAGRTDEGGWLLIRVYTEANKGKGEDAWAAGERYAFVFDGLGGTGARLRRNVDDERIWSEGKIASFTAAQAADAFIREHMEEWSGQMRCADEEQIAGYADEIVSRIQEAVDAAVRQEAGRWMSDSSAQPVFPTTAAGWLLFPREEGTLALAVWAGDSRCYTLDDAHMRLYTCDHAVQALDAMEELNASGSPQLSNRIGLDKTYKLEYRIALINKPALFLSCTDGIYGYLQSPMHLEFLLRACGNEDHEHMSDAIARFLVKVAGDDATLLGLYMDPSGDDVSMKDMLMAGIEHLTAAYIKQFPPAIEQREMHDIDSKLLGLTQMLESKPEFREALRQYHAEQMKSRCTESLPKTPAEVRAEARCKKVQQELDAFLDTLTVIRTVTFDQWRKYTLSQWKTGGVYGDLQQIRDHFNAHIQMLGQFMAAPMYQQDMWMQLRDTADQIGSDIYRWMIYMDACARVQIPYVYLNTEEEYLLTPQEKQRLRNIIGNQKSYGYASADIDGLTLTLSQADRMNELNNQLLCARRELEEARAAAAREAESRCRQTASINYYLESKNYVHRWFTDGEPDYVRLPRMLAAQIQNTVETLRSLDAENKDNIARYERRDEQITALWQAYRQEACYEAWNDRFTLHADVAAGEDACSEAPQEDEQKQEDQRTQ